MNAWAGLDKQTSKKLQEMLDTYNNGNIKDAIEWLDTQRGVVVIEFYRLIPDNESQLFIDRYEQLSKVWKVSAMG